MPFKSIYLNSKETEGDLAYAGSFPKCPQQLDHNQEQKDGVISNEKELGKIS